LVARRYTTGTMWTQLERSVGAQVAGAVNAAATRFGAGGRFG